MVQNGLRDVLQLLGTQTHRVQRVALQRRPGGLIVPLLLLGTGDICGR